MSGRRPLTVGLVVSCLVLAGCGGTDDTLADHPNPTLGPSVTQSAAVAAALEVSPGEVVEVLDDVDNGTLVYDVRVQGEDGVLVRTLVARNTGEVVVVQQLLDDGRVPNDGGPVDLP
jgi:hypothetical protein